MQKGNRNSCERQGTGHDGETEGGDTERLLQPHKVSGARTRKLNFIHYHSTFTYCTFTPTFRYISAVQMI